MAETAKLVRNNATDKVEGFLYQFYTALDYCFELKPGEKLYIEKYGDITIEKIAQIEVKKYSNPLTNVHDNFWNTLFNWCHDSFHPENYKYLALLTTQQIGSECLFKGWNEKSLEDKLDIIISIAKDYSEKNKDSTSDPIIAKRKHMLSIISDEKRDRLNSVLEKFRIIDCALGFEEIYESMKTKYARHILEENQDLYLSTLLGFVINPKIVSNNWEILCEDFSKKVQDLSGIYQARTVVFPKIEKSFSQEEIEEKKGSLFVKKIDDIKYDEDVKNEAISHYLYTNNLLLKDLASYKLLPNVMSSYENELLDSFKTKRRRYFRNASQNSNPTNIINESQNFYDDVTGEAAQPFVNFNDTPKRFRNGFYHIMADEDDDKIVWLLKEEDNDDKTI